MADDADVIVIGGGPAGAATAILLAKGGLDVILVEQHRFPRHKVCGECISAGALEILDKLGIGPDFRRQAGPELRHVGWMSAERIVVAEMPACSQGAYRYGRALGRQQLDTLLIERAGAVGVRILQPARVRSVHGSLGRFICEYELLAERASTPEDSSAVAPRNFVRTLRAPVVVDAHGSWERRSSIAGAGAPSGARTRRVGSDLLAFKTSFRNASLAAGLLPVISLNGLYGGMVVAEAGRLTLACCVRRDMLEKCRSRAAGLTAGGAVEAFLRHSCRGLAEALAGAQREGPWLSVGPVRPGISLHPPTAPLRVGNAAGEVHPLIGEGIGMALQSADILAGYLVRGFGRNRNANDLSQLYRQYSSAWRRVFMPRLSVAAAYAHLAMSPALTACAGALLARRPELLNLAARLAGKNRRRPLLRAT